MVEGASQQHALFFFTPLKALYSAWCVSRWTIVFRVHSLITKNHLPRNKYPKRETPLVRRPENTLKIVILGSVVVVVSLMVEEKRPSRSPLMVPISSTLSGIPPATSSSTFRRTSAHSLARSACSSILIIS